MAFQQPGGQQRGYAVRIGEQGTGSHEKKVPRSPQETHHGWAWKPRILTPTADTKVFKQQDCLDVGSNLKILCYHLRQHLDGIRESSQKGREKAGGEAVMYSQGILVKAHILGTEAGVE